MNHGATVTLKQLYDYNAIVDYLTIKKGTIINNKNDVIDEIQNYQQQLSRALKMELTTITNNPECIVKKCDEIYDCININDKHFMDSLLRRVLITETDGDINTCFLSNNMFFYMATSGLKTLRINTAHDFNALDHLDNDEYRRMVFSFLFSFNCFHFFHAVLNKYSNAGTKVQKDDEILGDLSIAIASLFQ